MAATVAPTVAPTENQTVPVLTDGLEPLLDRFERAKVDKFEARRAELAEAALETLGELGFARTSLREIARKTDFSHGVLHYYFRDKVELITYCVRHYKARRVTCYDDIVASSPDAATLLRDFADALVTTLLDDTAMHRLWYDLRTQAMFDPALQPTVTDLDGELEEMIWRVVARHAELAGSAVAVSAAAAYGVVDGLFENCLMRHLDNDTEAPERLRTEASWLIARLMRD